jgi:hypothetical protein
MRETGCVQTNPSHPDLLAVLVEGVTPEVLRDTVAEAVAEGKRKPFLWAITTARGRHAEGARAVSTGPPEGVALVRNPWNPGGTHATSQPRESLVDRAARKLEEIGVLHQ